MVGASLLALFTRRSDEGGLDASPVFGALALPVLLIGVVLAGLVLAYEQKRAKEVPVPAMSVERSLVAIALLVVVAAGVTMGQMGGLLAGFHQSGDAAVTHTAIQGAAWPPRVEARVEQALAVWSLYARPDIHRAEETDDLPSGAAFEEDRNAPITVLTWFFWLDAGLFVPGYLAVLGLALVLATRHLTVRAPDLRRSDRKVPPGAFVSLSRVATSSIVVAAFADQIENWIGLTSSTEAWFDGSGDPGSMSVDGALAALLGAATVVKTIAFALTLLLTVLIGRYVLRNSAPSRDAWAGVGSSWQSVLAVRVQIIGVALFALLLGMPFQVGDTFLRWADDGAVVIWASAIVVALAVSIWHSGTWMVTLASQPGRTRRKHDQLLVWLLSGATILALVAFSFAAGRPNFEAFLIPIGIGIVVAVLSMPARTVCADLPRIPSGGAGELPRLLAASLLAFFGLVILKAVSGAFVYSWMQDLPVRRVAALAVLGLGYLVASVALYRILPSVVQPDRPSDDPEPLHSAWVPGLVLLCCVIVWAVIVLILKEHVFAISGSIGTAGVLAGFLILLTYTLSSAIALAGSGFQKVPPIFRAAGLRRTPVLTLVSLWVVIASLIPLDRDHHVMIAKSSGTEATGETLEEAFDEWRTDNCVMPADPGEPRPDAGGQSSTVQDKQAVPLLMVSSSGGGVKAAVWTSYVMDRLFRYGGDGMGCSSVSAAEGAPRNRSIFLVSGISGGGLGFVQYAAQLAEGPPSHAPEGRIHAHLGADSLAATLAWMLYVEAPWSLLRFDATRDRAAILRESWLDQWDGPGLDTNFLALRDALPEEGGRLDEIPVIVLNGASAESGCRFNGSMLKANGRQRSDAVIGCLEPRGLEGSPDAALPATIDLVDFVCDGQEVSLADAALFTARFPGILPVGEIRQCVASDAEVDEEERRLDPDPETFVVDGGYLEGSGTATILDLWHALAPLITEHNLDRTSDTCIVPFFVQIDNSYLEPAGPGDTKEPPRFLGLQELSARGQVREGYTTASRQAAQIAFGRPFRLGNVRVGFTEEAPAGEDPIAEELTSRYVRFSPRAHPGPQAPLGWTMSRTSFADLFSQFGGNADSIREFDMWFQHLSCVVGEEPGSTP